MDEQGGGREVGCIPAQQGRRERDSASKQCNEHMSHGWLFFCHSRNHLPPASFHLFQPLLLAKPICPYGEKTAPPLCLPLLETYPPSNVWPEGQEEAPLCSVYVSTHPAKVEGGVSTQLKLLLRQPKTIKVLSPNKKKLTISLHYPQPLSLDIMYPAAGCCCCCSHAQCPASGSSQEVFWLTWRRCNCKPLPQHFWATQVTPNHGDF